MKKKQVKIIAFDQYIEVKYGAELHKCIANDVARVYPEFEVSPVNGKINVKKEYYYRGTTNDVKGVITVEAQLKVETTHLSETRVYNYSFEFAADFERDDIQITFRIAQEWRYRKCKRYLDEYLAPYAKLEQIKKAAEDILLECEDSIPKAEEIAEGLGLNVVSLRLAGKTREVSMLVFEDSTLTVDTDKTVTISANTIVLNSAHKCYDRFKAQAIAHECYHYMEHKEFCRFQRIAGNSYPELKKGENRNAAKKTLTCMEEQAGLGANFLLYPLAVASEDAKRALINHGGKYTNEGERYEEIIREISTKRVLPVSLVRRVLILLGYEHAKGAFCYVDGRYLRPFSFDIGEGGGTATYALSIKDVITLALQSSKLASALKSRKLVFVDGHLCVNNPEFIDTTEEGYTLTERARRSVNECCLKVLRFYEQSGANYEEGCLFFDETQLSSICRLADIAAIGEYGLCEKSYAWTREVSDLPLSFRDTVRKLRDNRNMTQEELAQKADIDRMTVARIENGLVQSYAFTTVVSLAKGFGLSQYDATLFFRKAGYVVDESLMGCAINILLMNIELSGIEALKEAARQASAIGRSKTKEKAIERCREHECKLTRVANS